MFESFLATLHSEQGPEALRTFLRAIFEPLLPIVVETLRPFHSAIDALVLAPATSYVGILMEWKDEKGAAGARTIDFAQEVSGRQDEVTWVVECRFADATDPEFAIPRSTIGKHSSIRGAKNLCVVISLSFVLHRFFSLSALTRSSSFRLSEPLASPAENFVSPEGRTPPNSISCVAPLYFLLDAI
jgi:hypothetical protein